MRLSKLLYQSSFLFITFISYGCIIDQNTKRDIIKIQKKYIPDKSLGVFEITLSKNLISNSISGYTSDSSAYTDMKTYSDSMNINFKVILLPEQSLQDSIYGIVNVSVTPLKEEPSHKSQMVDQALMGYPVKLLRKVDEWYLCQTHYGYIGWINKTAIYKGTKKDKNEWESLAIYKVSKMNSSVYSKPRIGSDPVNDLVLNNQLIVLKKLLKWYEISLPDVLKAQPDEKLLEKKLKFIPQKKQLIIFLSNPVSIHGVSKIVSEKKRIFAYGSYTLENKVIWKLN